MVAGEELPSDEEYAEAWQTMERLDWKVDYIITHCAPTAIQQKINTDFRPDKLTEFLEEACSRSQFHYWLFGHYHDNRIIDESTFCSMSRWCGKVIKQGKEKHGWRTVFFFALSGHRRKTCFLKFQVSIGKKKFG